MADRKDNRPIRRERPRCSWPSLSLNAGRRTEGRGQRAPAPEFRGTLTPPLCRGRFLRRNIERLDPRAQATRGLSVRLAWPVRQGGVCRQPGCVRSGSACCGGARAQGLQACGAGSTCRSGCARIFLITAGSACDHRDRRFSITPVSRPVLFITEWRFAVLGVRAVASRAYCLAFNELRTLPARRCRDQPATAISRYQQCGKS